MLEMSTVNHLLAGLSTKVDHVDKSIKLLQKAVEEDRMVWKPTITQLKGDMESIRALAVLVPNLFNETNRKV